MMDPGAPASDHDEHVDIGMRAFLLPGHRSVHPDRHEVPSFACPELPRQRLRELEPAREGHGRRIREGAHEPFRGSAEFMDRQRIPSP